MAIKVNGTTVIDNSRNFTNIAGGFKTVNGTSVVGSGNISAGASTSYGAVGTYVTGHVNNTLSDNLSSGETRSGSSIKYMSWNDGYNRGRPLLSLGSSSFASSSGLSGTWRNMGSRAANNDNNDYVGALFVRIS